MTGAIGEALNIPSLNMLELSYMFKNNKEVNAVLDSDPLNAAVKKSLAAKGLVLYAWSENGWRGFGTKGSATSPEQLQRYKMRSQESADWSGMVHLNMYRAMGVQAVAVPVSEVLPSLTAGIIDGFDNTPDFSLYSEWLGAVSHFTLSDHVYQPAAVVYSQTFIDSLPADLQEIVLKEPHKEAVYARKKVRAINEQLVKNMQERVNVVLLSKAEKKPFRKAIRKKTHTAFLTQHPAEQSHYVLIKNEKNSYR